MVATRRQFGAGTGAFAASMLLPSQLKANFTGEAEKRLHEAAREEGELTWYIAHFSADLAEHYGKKFTEAYPGVKVNVVRTTANVAYQRAVQELKAGGPQCDVLSSTDISHPLTLKTQGQLEKYVPANGATLSKPLQNVDPDGYFHLTSLGTIGIMFNTSKVNPAEAPKKWTDFLDPRWKNQVSLGHPAFSGYASIWCWEMQRLYGWDYFEKLKANNPQIGRSMLDPLTMLRSGERTVAHVGLAPAFEAKAKGDPIDVVYPEDGTMVVIAPSCILKGAKHPKAAMLFMEFMSSEAASRISVDAFGESAHDAVLPKVGIPLAKVKTMIAPPDKLQKGLPEVKEKWRDTFGV